MKFPILILISLLVVCSCKTHQDQKVSALPNYSLKQIDSVRQLRCNDIYQEILKSDSRSMHFSDKIPTTLNEAFTQLDTSLNDKIKSWIICLPDGEFASHVHFSLGLELRNHWGLWANSKLAQEIKKIGVWHPDDMTALIFTCYQRKLKHEDIKIDEQVKEIKSYWEKY